MATPPATQSITMTRRVWRLAGTPLANQFPVRRPTCLIPGGPVRTAPPGPPLGSTNKCFNLPNPVAVKSCLAAQRQKERRDSITAALRAKAGDLAQGVADGASDCEALAQFADYAASLDGYWGDFVNDFAILTPSQLASQLVPGVGSVSNPIFFQGAQSTYLGQYQNTDPADTSNQSHHFAAFLQVGAHLGFEAGAALAVTFEVGEAAIGFTGINYGDIQLGQAAAGLGSALSSGAIKVGDVGKWIRSNLCQ